MAKKTNDTPLLDSLLGLSPKPDALITDNDNSPQITAPGPLAEPFVSAGGVEGNELNEESQKEIEQQLTDEISREERSETEDINGKNISNDTGVGNNPDRPTFNVIINGKLLLFMTDATVPKAMRWGMEKVGYKTDKKLSELMLTDEEKKALEPAADAVVEEIFKHMSPLAQFGIALMGVYGAKL